MRTHHVLSTLLATLVLATASGCAVTRGQESVGAYVDDTAITAAVKTRFLDDKSVDGTSIRVETLNGTVMLSGFAKSGHEKAMAETLAWRAGGVKSVKNQITVMP